MSMPSLALRQQNPVLAEVREMRAELQKLDRALATLEGQVSIPSGRPPQFYLMPLDGWVKSLCESYVRLVCYDVANPSARAEWISGLTKFIEEQRRRFEREENPHNIIGAGIAAIGSGSKVAAGNMLGGVPGGAVGKLLGRR